MLFWFPKFFGRMYDRRMANVSWYLLIGGFNMLYFPMFVIGLQGMPRRYYDYLPMYQTGQMVSTIGSWVLCRGARRPVLQPFQVFLRAAHRGQQSLGGGDPGMDFAESAAAPDLP